MGGFDFTGRRVLVTGASHGIGFAVARAFAGAELAILSSTADSQDAAARIEAECGRELRALVCDIPLGGCPAERRRPPPAAARRPGTDG